MWHSIAMVDDAPEHAAARAIDRRSRSPAPWLIAAAALAAASLVARWPGVAMYDSVTQYQQALAGAYNDWHPPIMARTWALLARIHGGTAPFLLLQMVAWWGGFGLLAAALGRQARHGAAGLVLLVGAAPLWLGWATIVLKDAQMACCLVAATGIAAYWRPLPRDTAAPDSPRRRALPRAAGAAIMLLLVYATLVRGNAPFATIPFGLALFGWGGVRRGLVRCGLLLLVLAAVLGLAGPINHRLLGAEPSHVARALPIYDLAGIAHFARQAAPPGVSPAAWAAAERRGCYTPFYWNPYGEPAQCGFVGDALAAADDRGDGIFGQWIGAVVRHPIAYARHRIGHLNANLRFWVGPGERDATPPAVSEKNLIGLGGHPSAAGLTLIALAAVMAASPLGWPFLWLAIAVALLWATARAPATGQALLGRSLALSAALMSASFGLVSIASDLRYHLWSMVASALALVLLADARAVERRRAIVAGAFVSLLLVVAILGHAGLAPPVAQPRPVRSAAPPGSPRETIVVAPQA